MGTPRGCPGPSTAESPLPPGPRSASSALPRALPRGFPPPKPPWSRGALPEPMGGAASPTRAPQARPAPLLPKFVIPNASSPPTPTFCTIFVNRFYIKRKKNTKKEKKTAFCTVGLYLIN